VKLNTSPKDYRPIKVSYMVEFRDGQVNVISELLREFVKWRLAVTRQIFRARITAKQTLMLAGPCQRLGRGLCSAQPNARRKPALKSS